MTKVKIKPVMRKSNTSTDPCSAGAANILDTFVVVLKTFINVVESVGMLPSVVTAPVLKLQDHAMFKKILQDGKSHSKHTIFIPIYYNDNINIHPNDF